MAPPWSHDPLEWGRERFTKIKEEVDLTSLDSIISEKKKTTTYTTYVLYCMPPLLHYTLHHSRDTRFPLLYPVSWLNTPMTKQHTYVTLHINR